MKCEGSGRGRWAAQPSVSGCYKDSAFTFTMQKGKFPKDYERALVSYSDVFL